MTVQRGPLKLPGMAWMAVAFKPWIVHWATWHIPDLSLSVKIGVPFLMAALLWGYRRAFAEPTLMETCTPIYFGLAGLAALLDVGFIAVYGDVIGLLVLAGIWLHSLAGDMPLTGEYSKWQWPPAIWDTPVFIETNAIITAAWVGVYLLQAAAALLGHFAPEQAWLWTAARYSLLVPAFAFTAWFQKWYPIYKT